MSVIFYALTEGYGLVPTAFGSYPAWGYVPHFSIGFYISLGISWGIFKVDPKTAYVEVSHAQDALRNGTSLCLTDLMRVSQGGAPSYILFMRKSNVSTKEGRDGSRRYIEFVEENELAYVPDVQLEGKKRKT